MDVSTNIVTETLEGTDVVQPAKSIPQTTKPIAYEYIDYRDYLRDAFNHIKFKNPAYSESAFIQAAGLGKNSRGYLGLILKGKRNISINTILGFAEALKLNPKESMYFENMVHFNQADNEEKKAYFFERMKVSAHDEKGKSFEILESQFRYISKWYLVVLREVVNLKDFKEDETWIVKKMRFGLTKEEVRQGLQDLQNLGLITRDSSGKLSLSQPHITFTDNKHNFKNAFELHRHFASKVCELLEKDPYEKRSARLTTLSCRKEDFENIRRDIREFSDSILTKYATPNIEPDVVLQLGMQLLHITD